MKGGCFCLRVLVILCAVSQKFLLVRISAELKEIISDTCDGVLLLLLLVLSLVYERRYIVKWFATILQPEKGDRLIYSLIQAYYWR